jgi:hypothetical protein
MKSNASEVIGIFAKSSGHSRAHFFPATHGIPFPYRDNLSAGPHRRFPGGFRQVFKHGLAIRAERKLAAARGVFVDRQ